MAQEKIAKKSYYLPEKLTEAFGEWCKPGRDLSPKIAGAILLWMAIESADLREKLVELAYKDNIPKARREAALLLFEGHVKDRILDHLSRVSPDPVALEAVLKRVIQEANGDILDGSS